jgi:putative ABC transport system permease protein
MFRNYLQAAFRILIKERVYTIINIIGLAIGLASCFLIFSWVKSEQSYDRFPGSDRIFRVTTHQDESSEPGIASTYPMMKNRVLNQFPEVEACVRVFDQGFLGSKTRVTYHDKVFIDNRFYYADSTFLHVFPLAIAKGDGKTCLSKPNAIILTESTARKIFGDEDPIGKTIRVGVDFDFEVTALVKDIPFNSHYHFDLLASMQSHPWIKNAENNVWSGVVFHTYIKLKDRNDAAGLQRKIKAFMDNFPDDPQGIGKSYDFRLQPIEDIHLTSHLKFELEENGNIYYVNLFITIASLVLLVAIFNYINLTTARHTQRVKEVGVRKIFGAGRRQLIHQFVIESCVLCLVAFVLAFFLVEIVRPILSNLFGSDFFNTSFWTAPVLLAAVALCVVIGLATGVIPALFLSSFKPVKLFKANLGTFAKGATLRKFLVVSQFTVSIALTISTAIIYKQLVFIREADLGYDKEHTVVLNIGYAEVRKQYTTLKTALGNHSTILGSTAASQLPTDIQTGENIDVSVNQSHGVNCASVDPDFFNVMGIEVKAGQQLIQSIIPNDSLNYFVLNESALKELGWSEAEALNKSMSIRHGNQKPGPVRGVIRDFHFQSFHNSIGALVLEFNPRDYQYLLVKIKPEHTEETIQYISEVWKKVAGSIPFDFMFLDQEYDKIYRAESRSSILFIIFSVVALFISLLGLFGLSAFAAEKRTKEIGLRKILGAGVNNIMLLVSRDFIFLLMASFFFALPIGYYFMKTWLTDFVFKVNIHPSLFVWAGVINILFALLTLTYHTIRIAKTNPVDTLKYE